MTTWSATDPRFRPLLTVAARLGALCDEVVFLGGAIVPLLVTDQGAASARPTDDVDLAVEVTTRVEYYRLSDRLRALGFAEDQTPGAPICRWVVDEVKVDIMPTEESVLGYSNTWFRAAVRSAPRVAFINGHVLRVISAPCFVAAKLEAFADRGEGDHVMSHDLEDVVAVVDGRVELLPELPAAPPEVRAYVASTVRRLLGDPAFIDALPGHLPPDEASQARLPVLLDRLRRIAVAG
jgi:predicted nucleotidyltransferase